MKLILSLALFLLAFPTAYSSDLCNRLNGIIDLHERQKNENAADRSVANATLIVDLILKEMFSSAESLEREVLSDEGYYSKFYVNFRAEGKTIHTIFASGRAIRDTVLVLDLPLANEVTPWSRLSATQRLLLANRIEKLFANALYDESLLKDPLSAYPPDSDHALSPRLLLRAAAKRELIGVCRQANCALAGILGELGIPQNHLRLVHGKSRPEAATRHIWVEIKHSEQDRWHQLDGTGCNRMTPETRALVALLNRINSGNPIPRRNLRESYPVDLTEINDFLTVRSPRELGFLTEEDVNEELAKNPVLTREFLSNLFRDLR